MGFQYMSSYFNLGNYLFLLLGIALSLVGSFIKTKEVASVTYALLGLIASYALFLGFILFTGRIAKYRLVIIALCAFFMSLVFGNINYYVNSNLYSLQIVAAGFIIVFINSFVWILILGTTEDNFDWGPSSNNILSHTRNETNSLASQSVHSNQESLRNGVTLPVVLRCVALYSYEASEDDPTEMSFVKGEILDVLDNNGKWWQARRADGAIGIVPSNYFKILDK